MRDSGTKIMGRMILVNTLHTITDDIREELAAEITANGSREECELYTASNGQAYAW